MVADMEEGQQCLVSSRLPEGTHSTTGRYNLPYYHMEVPVRHHSG